MNANRRLWVALGGLATITAVGTLGYRLIEGLGWIEALYMTVITISTVGYDEVAPLTSAGRAFTMGLIVVGVGSALYLLTVIAETFFEGRLRELALRSAMQRTIERMEAHVIVCGYGRFGRVVTEELESAATSVVIVEVDPELESDLVRAGLPYVIGSGTSDDVLHRAGIERASAIVVATSSDSDNVFITLAARELNPAARIHARGETPSVHRRLVQAGADQIVSSYRMGGQRMAAAIVRPSVVDFLEISAPRRGESIDLEEIAVAAGSELVGQSVGKIGSERTQVHIVALKRDDTPIQLLPRSETVVHPGDHLVVIGDRDPVDELARLASRSG